MSLKKNSRRIEDGFVRPNLTEAVANHLRRAIVRPGFGDRLPGERHIADALGVSRPVVRDALALLETEGLILRRQGSGTRVARGSSVDMLSGSRPVRGNPSETVTASPFVVARVAQPAECVVS